LTITKVTSGTKYDPPLMIGAAMKSSRLQKEMAGAELPTTTVISGWRRSEVSS
jgi:hypothetical protein